MQTSFIAESRCQELDRSVHSLVLSQLLGRAADDRDDTRSDLSCAVLENPPQDRTQATGGKIEESIAFMTRNLNRPLQVSTLAALVNISPSHYFALFKRQTGFAPISYFTRLRMEEARRLLEMTEASVKEVAAQLGYDDPFYFSRVFKSVNQLAPTNYRLRRRAEIQAVSGENSP